MKNLVALVLLLSITACNNSSYDETLLVGEWKVHTWKIASNGEAINQKMDFTFDANKKYAVDYGSEKDSGTYYLSGDYLYAKGTNATEISVRLTQLTKDSLSMEMNRQGRLENVLLLKK